MKKEHALIYLNKHLNYKNKILALLKQYQFDYTFIGDDQLENTINELFDMSNTNSINKAFDFDFLFFKNIDHTQVLSFYKECAKQGFPFTHKAVLTEHNQNWKLNDLLNEINQEHEFFNSWKTLKNLLQEANDLNENEYTNDSYLPYQNCFINAYMYTKQDNVEKTQIDTFIKELTQLKNQLIKKDS